MLVWAWLAQAEGTRGDGEAAAAALRRSEEAYGPQFAVFLPELELARAWERASVGQTTAAQTHAVHAAQIARHSAMCAVEMRALHTAVRFAPPTTLIAPNYTLNISNLHAPTQRIVCSRVWHAPKGAPGSKQVVHYACARRHHWLNLIPT